MGVNRKRYTSNSEDQGVQFVLHGLLMRLIRIESKLHNIARELNIDIGDKDEETRRAVHSSSDLNTTQE